MSYVFFHYLLCFVKKSFKQFVTRSKFSTDYFECFLEFSFFMLTDELQFMFFYKEDLFNISFDATICFAKKQILVHTVLLRNTGKYKTARRSSLVYLLVH